MKGLEKLTSMRLAEVLTQKGIVPVETITDALYIQDKCGESFVDVMVDSGHIAEWDLARVVVESFQLPFLLAGSYEINDAAKDRLPKETLFENLMVPLDVFDDVLTVSMPVLTASDVMLNIEAKFGLKIFPYVGLISENKKVLSDEFSTFKQWYQEYQEQKEKRSKVIDVSGSARSDAGEEDGGWTNLFDAAEEAVQASIKNQRS